MSDNSKDELAAYRRSSGRLFYAFYMLVYAAGTFMIVRDYVRSGYWWHCWPLYAGYALLAWHIIRPGVLSWLGVAAMTLILLRITTMLLPNNTDTQGNALAFFGGMLLWLPTAGMLIGVGVHHPWRKPPQPRKGSSRLFVAVGLAIIAFLLWRLFR